MNELHERVDQIISGLKVQGPGDPAIRYIATAVREKLQRDKMNELSNPHQHSGEFLTESTETI